ncbi:hypothetical protein HYV82_06225 [Candidatus Woesearchaeota archaeon]|nr:hypothetical protein [Candidatus Woesearchaeota archaeon]
MNRKGGVITLSSEMSEADMLRSELNMALKGVREELDEHLDISNQTTEEVQSNYEYLCRLDEKVDRLAERIEQIALMMRNAGVVVAEQQQQEKFDLTEKEKEVFLVLYTAGSMVTYKDIASGVHESEFLARSYVTQLIQKGVPVKKRYINSAAYLELDARFREMQAKRNILNISQKTVGEFC